MILSKPGGTGTKILLNYPQYAPVLKYMMKFKNRRRLCPIRKRSGAEAGGCQNLLGKHRSGLLSDSDFNKLPIVKGKTGARKDSFPATSKCWIQFFRAHPAGWVKIEIQE